MSFFFAEILMSGKYYKEWFLWLLEEFCERALNLAECCTLKNTTTKVQIQLTIWHLKYSDIQFS